MNPFPPLQSPQFFTVTSAAAKQEVLDFVPAAELIQTLPPRPLIPLPPATLEGITLLHEQKKILDAEEKERKKALAGHPPPAIPNKKRLYLIVSQNQKQKLADLYLLNGLTPSTEWYAMRTGIRGRRLEDFLKILSRGGNILDPVGKRGRKKKRDSPFINDFCRTALRDKSTTTLRELSERLTELHHPISRSTIDILLTEAQKGDNPPPLFTFKRIIHRVPTANTDGVKAQRVTFLLTLMAAYDEGRFVIYLDETSWNVQCVRQYGWGLKGQPLLGESPPSFQSVTAITSISQNGVGYTEIIRGGIDAAVFESYIRRLLTSLPVGQRYAIVMDNATIHHVQTDQLLTDAGHKVIYNAAYSPEGNPIETLFGVWKSRVEKMCTRGEGEATFFEVVKDVLIHIEPEEVRPHIERVRRDVWPKIATRADL
jgi:transposase